MTIIEAAAMRCRTMSDGSLRIEVEIEPRNAQAAFALFGVPGRAVALAALKDGAGAVAEPVQEKPKGGQWAKLAGMWCNDDDFYRFIQPLYDIQMGGEGRGHGDVMIGIEVKDIPEFCAHALKLLCEIDSRVELDNDPAALARFNVAIRYPFQKWMIARGISKAAP